MLSILLYLDNRSFMQKNAECTTETFLLCETLRLLQKCCLFWELFLDTSYYMYDFVALQKGKHIFEINWPRVTRSTLATVGVGNEHAPLVVKPKASLVGCNKYSWGLDIARYKCLHRDQQITTMPRNKLIPDTWVECASPWQGWFSNILSSDSRQRCFMARFDLLYQKTNTDIAYFQKLLLENKRCL